ncbi:hypothetical protein ASPWEDRAFT_42851 [Aspergillus wentii DTO 134E9]|uniref:Uncharacterized protein n=1 Tax=Aspergillus wentii DTO 134E9 TaxID=1073089 RepID=A0A1L9RD32_ASPWE|nr:uncharacterized protein ASPWEDRAFT_42851 [Aspergillus wentii DTO 134E9]KAI9933097.1 hypothetical protein MW887_007568 [Aspergillus wentii]OJJ32822.1 hypothetical protein ASPWEDRAFT_42851 [Aspergillus wentii DTO 134E9]
MSFQLSIAIFGSGISEPAHWGFCIHIPGEMEGELLHVRVIDVRLNIFQFEPRIPHDLESQTAFGLCKLRNLNSAERSKVASILAQEPAPRGGKENCQNWVVDALVALEVEELVPDGTADIWNSRIGKESDDIKADVEDDYWFPLNER